MESYFLLHMSDRVQRPLTILGLPSRYQRVVDKKAFDRLDQAIVAYFCAEAQEEIPCVLHDPSFLISDELKKLFCLYMPDLQMKIVQLFAGEKERHENCMYWLPYFRSVSCLHKDAERYPDGSIKKLIIDKTRLPHIPIFRVNEILEFRVIVELSVAESILRRCPYGVGLTPVEVK
ncbi:hypothetical protein [Anaeromassilibacillus sp. An200]|uniref:hypothetical protein n=1 Tax=Anaeromassilibacillus sp. An200 TaxID=1965587 RepID=UPI000B3AD6F8|nr:hypothetical protein [Anaeromassilibacillus sp. An200]OUP07852.1 hypothetical protein B5F35_13940 [Anaeromassilibacillus sp. An200]